MSHWLAVIGWWANDISPFITRYVLTPSQPSTRQPGEERHEHDQHPVHVEPDEADRLGDVPAGPESGWAMEDFDALSDAEPASPDDQCMNSVRQTRPPTIT